MSLFHSVQTYVSDVAHGVNPRFDEDLVQSRAAIPQESVRKAVRTLNNRWWHSQRVNFTYGAVAIILAAPLANAGLAAYSGRHKNPHLATYYACQTAVFAGYSQSKRAQTETTERGVALLMWQEFQCFLIGHRRNFNCVPIYYYFEKQ
jgi:hypothetical protein